MSINRRAFLASTSAALLGTRPVAARSPNEIVNVAVLGSGRGQTLARWFATLPNSQVVAVCDVDENRGRPLADRIGQLSQHSPAWVSDFRTLLDRPDIDAVAIATPDHWHAPITIHACLAGKDVYVEKPVSHNAHEGRMAIQAARHHQRIVQHGTQLRAAPHYQAAWKLLKEGVIGKVHLVKAINNQRRGRMPHRPDSEVPQGVDYDLWTGPAPKRPFNRNRFHYGWHWMWDFGTGDIGNDGVHQIDIGRWALDLKEPRAVSCSAAKLGSRGDAQETPDTMVVTWEYDDVLFVYEQRDFTPYRMQGHRNDNDNIIFGDEGYMIVDRDGYRVFYKNEPGPNFYEKWEDRPAHYQNFIDCVKSRRQQDLIAEIEEGHRSALLCHLANIAYRTGTRLRFDAEQERFIDSPDANALLRREYRQGYELPKVPGTTS